MPPFLRFTLRRFAYAVFSLIIITMVLYAGFMLTPPEARAELYIPRGRGGERVTENFIRRVIEEKHLDEPYLVQYAYWAKAMLAGSWGYSPSLGEDVLASLLHRTPATLELAVCSLLLLIPLGLAAGLVAGWRPRQRFDHIFRSTAFLATAIPPFILSLILLAIFYVRLDWFAPGRTDIAFDLAMADGAFRTFTGLLTIDSLLNARPDLFVLTLRHLALPVITLALYHWAVLGRITRASVISERSKDHIVAARARGVKESRLMRRHAFRAVLGPSLTNAALAAAALVTGIFVIEIIYNINGVSRVIVSAMSFEPDAPAALGFTVYSVIMVLGLMFVLDVVLAAVDPRIRDEILEP
jgi:peptide/nickel transport system permease protein